MASSLPVQSSWHKKKKKTYKTYKTYVNKKQKIFSEKKRI